MRLAIGLAATAGFVDAFIYLRVTPVLVANMSGNLIHLGIATGTSDWRAVSAAGIALASFLVGAGAATMAIDTGVRRGRAPAPSGLLFVESLLLFSLPVILLGSGVSYSPSIAPIDYLVVAVGATAMGIQAVALRRVGQVAVSTTYGTGAVVRLGEKLALAIRRTDRPGGHKRRVTIAVLAAVLVSYVAGALLGTSVGSSPTLLLIPATMPLIAAVRN